MRNYDGYQLVSEAINPHLKRAGIGAAIFGGTAGGLSYAIYDKQLTYLKNKLKRTKSKWSKDLIRSEISQMEKLGKKKWVLKNAAITGVVGGIANYSGRIGKKSLIGKKMIK